jgi:hypothetical protein
VKQLLGISEAIWDEMRNPMYGGGEALDITTPLYMDIMIAMEYFGLLYPDYIQRTTEAERFMYQLYLGLKNLKERHAQKRLEEQHTIEREMQSPSGPPVRTY